MHFLYLRILLGIVHATKIRSKILKFIRIYRSILDSHEHFLYAAHPQENPKQLVQNLIYFHIPQISAFVSYNLTKQVEFNSSGTSELSYHLMSSLPQGLNLMASSHHVLYLLPQEDIKNKPVMESLIVLPY
jgi:hypothetical protein